MTTTWTVILLVALTTLVLRGAGPALLRDRTFPQRVGALIDHLAPALLTALVVVDLAGPGWTSAEARVLPGLGLAAWLRWRGAPAALCVLAAVVVTVGLRAAG